MFYAGIICMCIYVFANFNESPATNQNSWVDIADNTIKRVVPPVTDIDASNEYIVLVTAGKGMLVSENDAPNP